MEFWRSMQVPHLACRVTRNLSTIMILKGYFQPSVLNAGNFIAQMKHCCCTYLGTDLIVMIYLSAESYSDRKYLLNY